MAVNRWSWATLVTGMSPGMRGTLTPERIEACARIAQVEQDIWPLPSTIPLVPPDPSLNKTPFSDFIRSGRVVYQDVLEAVYANINKLYDKNIPVPPAK